MSFRTKFKSINLSLLLILIIGFALRIWSLTIYWGIHDVYFYLVSSRAIYDVILTQNTAFWGTFLYNGQGPLFFLINGALMTIFDLNYIFGPIVNIIFSLLTIYLTYKIALIVFNRRVAILSSFFFSILPWQIYLTKTFLVDASASFFFLLSIYLYILYLKTEPYFKLKYLIYMGITIGIGALVKYYIVLAAVCIYFHYLIYLKFKNFKDQNFSNYKIFKKSLFLLPFLLIGIGILSIWLFYSDTITFLFNPLQMYALSPSSQPTISGISNLFLVEFLLVELTPILLVCLIYGIYYCYRHRNQFKLVLIVSIAIYTLIIYVLFFLGTTRINSGIPKYYLPMLPFLCIFSVIGLLNIGKIIRKLLMKFFHRFKNSNGELFNNRVATLIIISSSLLFMYSVVTIEINKYYSLNNSLWIRPMEANLVCSYHAAQFVVNNLTGNYNISGLYPENLAIGFFSGGFIPLTYDNESWIIDRYQQMYIVYSSVSVYYNLNITWLIELPLTFNYTYGGQYIRIYNYSV